jgi:hypothetical protein
MLIDDNANANTQEQVQTELEPRHIDTNESLRFQLLVLSKEILMGRAAMKWETHKQYESVSVNTIVDEANKMYEFIKGAP